MKISWKQSLLVFLSILLLSLCIHRQHLYSFPKYIHAWAQCDHYALAKGFIDNDFDLFHPQTYVLNKQFPNNDSTEAQTPITAVDFPVNNYIVATVMKITGTNAPLVFRLYMLLYSCIGLTFLFKLSLFILRNWLGAIVFVLFAWSSTVYLDYQDGFLPSMSALSNLFIGSYFLNKYWQEKVMKHFAIGVGLLSLAALMRTPFVIFLIALIGETFLENLRLKKLDKKKWSILLVGFFIPLIYFLYNSHLAYQYGSIFLSSPMPPRSLSEGKYVITEVWNVWLTHYFSYYHYALFLSILLLFSASIYLTKHKIRWFANSNLSWIGISSIGILIYSVLMARQFQVHDYYFLDTFYLPFVLLVTLLIKPILKVVKPKYTLAIFGIGLLPFAFYSSLQILSERRHQEIAGDVQTTFFNFSGAATFLSSIGIAPDAKILVLDAYAPNMPFLLMERHGYAVLNTSSENIKMALDFQYDYIIIQNYFLQSDVVNSYPGIVKKIHFLASNGKISVFAKNKIDSDNQGIVDLLQLNSRPPRKEFSNYKEWANFYPDTLGDNIGLVKKNKEFGATLELQDSPLFINNPSQLLFSGEIKLPNENSQCKIVMDIHDQGKRILYQPMEISISEKGKNAREWGKFQFFFSIPKLHDEHRVRIYLHNTHHELIKYKYFKLQVF